MKISMGAVLIAVAALGGCAKHECELDSDGKKDAFGKIADMTEGAFSCDVEGASAAGGLVQSDLKCDIGSSGCVPTMHAIHGSPSKVADVAAKYKGWLEKNGWKVEEEKKIEGNFMNGKPFEGVQLAAKSGDKDLSTRVVPFGDDMVETTTFLAALK